MNDISNVSMFAVSLFADDTCLVLSHINIRSLEIKCNKALEIIDDWFKANKLTANLKKASKYMLILGKRINKTKFTSCQSAYGEHHFGKGRENKILRSYNR